MTRQSMWTRVAAVPGFLVLAWVGAFAADAPPSTPASPAKPTAEERAQIGKLRLRASQWLNARKELIQRCATCDGSGFVVYFAGGGAKRHQCGACSGTGWKLSDTSGRIVFYDIRSPMWRVRPNARSEANAEYLANGPSLHLASWRIERIQLAGLAHGTVYVVEGKDSVARATRWVLVAEERKSPQWYLWTDGVDPAWPTESKNPELDIPGPDTTQVEPLTEEQSVKVDEAMQGLTTFYCLHDRRRAGRVLILTLDPSDVPVERTLQAQLESESIAIIRAVVPVLKDDFDLVRLDFLAIWQDRFGERRKFPTWTVSMDSSTFARVRWGNLDQEAAFALFTVSKSAQPGATLVTR